MLRSIYKNIWVAESAQSFQGVEVGARMTIIRMADDSLFIHSPIRLNEELKAEILKLGKPRYVVAPNCFHHLHAGDFAKAFPTATLYLAPDLAAKRPDLRGATTIQAGTSYPWSKELDFIICQGMPKLNEVIFLHSPSRSLLITDLAFNFGPQSSFSAKIFAFLTGIYGQLGFSRFDRLLFIRDKKAAEETFRKILSWDFDRILLCHGNIVESNGKQLLAFALLGRTVGSS